MRKIILDNIWIVCLSAAIVLISVFTFPSKENQLQFIENRIDDIQMQREVLTDREKELEKLATEKDWEEVDKDSNK